MQTVRTPDEQFAGLADFPYQPHYVEVDDGEGGTLRVHHLDEGPADAAPVLLMHGEPTWAYLYRKMVPALVDAGHRVIVPDLVGFGRSDKPAEVTDHTYARHVAWTSELLLDKLGLTDITLFCQDWGGLIGLRIVAAAPERFARVVAANTGLPDGEHRLGPEWWAFHDFVQRTEDLPVGFLVQGGCAR
ncbi:MAG: haloalkane dehalogenase, partial [Iamia sp.]